MEGCTKDCVIKHDTRISHINLSYKTKKDIVYQNLNEIMIPVLANIIMSYYYLSWSWRYVESHAHGRSCTDCVVTDGKVSCFYANLIPRRWMINFNTKYDIGKCAYSRPLKICYDESYIYVMLNKSIRVIHYYENIVSEVYIYICESGIQSTFWAIREFIKSIKHIKNGIFYTTDLRDHNYTLINSKIPHKKYLIKNISLYSDILTRIVGTERTLTCRKCVILSILVDDEIIISVYDKHTSVYDEHTEANVFKKVDNTNMIYIKSHKIINLLYQDCDDVIYTYADNSNLVLHNKFTGEKREIVLGANDKICLDRDILCIQNFCRIDVYKRI